uniref:putative serine protease 42 n=1 Tax=Halichoerus grypus TaxID=9711 RepID=UPI00165A0A27|nr:putative serine protease 42 [Halichoerus grypus]
MEDRSVYKEIASVVIPVRNIIIHPQLSVVRTVKKDLALLRLLYPVNFTVTIQPVCIPQKTFRVEAGTTCWVTGWGRKEEYGGDPITAVLHEVDQDIMHHEMCNTMIQKAITTKKSVVLEGCSVAIKKLGRILVRETLGALWSVNLRTRGSRWESCAGALAVVVEMCLEFIQILLAMLSGYLT